MLRRTTLIFITALLLAACDVITGADLTQPRSSSSLVENSSSTTATTQSPIESSTTTATPTGPAIPGLALVPDGGIEIFGSPGGTALQTVHQGLVLPVTGVEGSWFAVMDSCSNPVWVNQADIQIVPKSSPQPTGASFDLTDAVVIVDAGHGGRDWGAPGPNGTRESNFNLDIADRLRDLLLSAHDVDWDSGRIGPGSTYPAISGAYMTRDTVGPDGGDFEAGLAYRATMANSAGADALIAIHNNTGADRTLDDPPTAVFYALSVEGSDRLASLIDEEVVRSLDPFSDVWRGSALQGTASRLDVETDTDFYGLLRRSDSPAVIVEGAFVSVPNQERLLETTVFRQAYAEGVYRGLLRFLTSDEIGSAINEPEPFQGDVGSPSTTNCVVPAQP